MYYLYIKTHNQTGLKYLGQTTKDPFSYMGSGILWKRHLQKYGNDIRTQILLKTTLKTELKEIGIFFSNIFNIVKSNEWANLSKEEGNGGNLLESKTVNEIAEITQKRKNTCIQRYGVENINQLSTRREYYRKLFTNRIVSEETKAKMSMAKQGQYDGENNPNFGNTWSDEQRRHQSDIMKNRYVGENNPMYGKKRADVSARNRLQKRWVTNGTETHLILRSRTDEYMQKGYWVGRT